MNHEHSHDQAVFCIADNRLEAIAIAEGLRAAGFRESEISFVMADGDDGAEIVMEGNTKMPEGATTGAGSGLLLGGALGWAVGIGALAIPGLGPFIAAGPIMAALGGAAIGSAAGGLTGGLIGLGFSEYEAKEYEGHLKEGRALISVRVENSEEVERAKEIYNQAGAEHISVKGVASVN
ncbi:hypothetical protein Pla52o_14730 [Novipirellula galeiformis]|uniref:Heat induced stress protein YflT n=1 Tax=Novipirellula galeiformis TaxID=2528004 RepID=A0A5C6CM74_9BACT|nr:hypothetical protein [Novipirellula galeiformis]TWU25175.1 hypothetical protein Pla52o_14730 [Novipirellula galeiformis]